MTEVWRAIPDWPQYEVSSHGRVRSLTRKITDSLGRTRTKRQAEYRARRRGG